MRANPEEIVRQLFLVWVLDTLKYPLNPDICIAETFKVLAKKYYEDKWFPRAIDLTNARNRLRKAITTSPKSLRLFKRRIAYHDVATSRDIIISVDRFYELFHKYKKRVSLPDLLIVATAKYLVDFFDLPRTRLHIITLDQQLWEGTKVGYLPRHAIRQTRTVIDPTE